MNLIRKLPIHYRALSRFSIAFALYLFLYLGCAESAVDPSQSEDRNQTVDPIRKAPPTREKQKGPKVVFIGNSIAAGLHLPRDEAFPAVLHRMLTDDGHSFSLLNAGVSGDTTSAGLRRLDWILKQQPDGLVVELGGNDGLRGIELALIEENLRRILTRAKESGAKILLLGMRLPPNYGEEYTGGFEEIYPRLAKELETGFVPFFMRGVGGVPDLNLPDGLHPNTEGHEILALTVFPYLRDLLQDLAQSGLKNDEESSFDE